MILKLLVRMSLYNYKPHYKYRHFTQINLSVHKDNVKLIGSFDKTPINYKKKKKKKTAMEGWITMQTPPKKESDFPKNPQGCTFAANFLFIFLHKSSFSVKDAKCCLKDKPMSAFIQVRYNQRADRQTDLLRRLKLPQATSPNFFPILIN